MLTKYFFIIKVSAFGFFSGLALCLGLESSPIVGFILFNIGSLVGLYAVVALEVSGSQLIKWIKLLVGRIKFSGYSLKRKIKNDKQNAHRRKRALAYIQKKGTVGLFFLSLLPIPYFTFILVSAWITLKVKNGLWAMTLGTICKSSIAIVVVYVLGKVLF